jgi:hypothetical protein
MLIESLLDGDCLVHRVSRNMLSVLHLYARDRHEAHLELGVFLRAWAFRNAPARAALVVEEC